MGTNKIPVGSATLGRVLNAAGEPIDTKGKLENVTYVPLYLPVAQESTFASIPAHICETGIKAVDLLAPIFYGNIVGAIASMNVGRDVLLEELMQTMLARPRTVVIIACMNETTYAASTLYTMVRDIEAEDRITAFFEPTTEDISAHQQLLRAAMTSAAHMRNEEYEVLLIVDSHLAIPENMADLRHFTTEKGVLSIVYVQVDDLGQPIVSSILPELDVQWWFSKERASQRLWPAVDPLASHSPWLESQSTFVEHKQVAQGVRDMLQRYYELRKESGRATSSKEEQAFLTQGERIDLFLTQPFTVAEPYTDIPGAYLTIEETISSFRDLLAGRYDNVPAQAFSFIGKIE